MHPSKYLFSGVEMLISPHKLKGQGITKFSMKLSKMRWKQIYKSKMKKWSESGKQGITPRCRFLVLYLRVFSFLFPLFVHHNVLSAEVAMGRIFFLAWYAKTRLPKLLWTKSWLRNRDSITGAFATRIWFFDQNPVSSCFILYILFEGIMVSFYSDL